MFISSLEEWSIIRSSCYSCNWNFSVLQILALWESKLWALLLKPLEVWNINSTIDWSRYQTFVLVESHRCYSSRVFLKEMLFDSQYHINNDDCSVNQTNSESLKLIFMTLILATTDLVWHLEVSCWFIVFYLESNVFPHCFESLFKNLFTLLGINNLLFELSLLTHLFSALLNGSNQWC